MSDVTICLIAIGCNQGDCGENIRSAVEKIDSLPGSSVLKISSMWKTSPVGDVQGQFLNGALLLETELQPDVLMNHLLQIEQAGGRDRQRDPGNRPIDLDILLFGQHILNTELLVVPHPRMSFRRFVLEPAAEIAPEMSHPILKTTLAQLLDRLRKERNIIAVLLDENDSKKLTAEKARSVEASQLPGNLNWLAPQSSSELLSGIRKHFGENRDVGPEWLVVVVDQPELLSGLRGAIKLLMFVNHQPADRSVPAESDHIRDAGLLNGYSGPAWYVESQSISDLLTHVTTAIDSMSPLQNDN